MVEISCFSSSTFSNCSAISTGGAIRNYDYNTTITTISSSTFTNCSATDGGAIDNMYSTISSISSSNFFNCSAAQSGGAIYNYDASTISSVTSSSFKYNWAYLYGGTIFSGVGIINMHFCHIYPHFSRWDEVHSPTTRGIVNVTDNWWGTNADP